MKKYLCVHGHFYQPPRENPWLEAIEVQDAVAPYHDWNEKIAAECYAANGASRIVNGKNRILAILSNYAKISFDFGPTLLSWMERHAPKVYRQILEADGVSRERYSGHGNGIAQAYNHLIMPLATRRDKTTQILWGIEDFKYRFGRMPEGMWLPETAVDMETLEIMADQGILFTILSPGQAKRQRKIGTQKWEDVSESRIDPTRTYRCFLKTHKSIDLFFYDGPISKAVAFEKLLESGEEFSRRLSQGFSDQRPWPQLVHIATDGESYGHHHRFGEMALTDALYRIERRGDITLTNYGEFLEKHPPEMEIEIYENTSWSCFHGVERWKADCGCSTGAHPAWHQKWRRPLRESLDWLRDRLAENFQDRGSQFFKDCWEARNQYIRVILNRNPKTVDAFFKIHARRDLDISQATEALELLEAQRYSLLMFASCGWFFDDISGLEAVQILKHASRAIQLGSVGKADIEREFLRRLAEAPSNVPSFENGVRVYRELVLPAVADMDRVIVQYAIGALFESYPKEQPLYCYKISQRDSQIESNGPSTLAVGWVRAISNITLEAKEVLYAVLYFGAFDFHCSVKGAINREEYNRIKDISFQRYGSRNLTEVVHGMDQHFGTRYYTLKDLFLDEKRKIAQHIADGIFGKIEDAYHLIYDEHHQIMEYLREVDVPIPKGFTVAAEYALGGDLTRELKRSIQEKEQSTKIREIIDGAKRLGIKLASSGIEGILHDRLEEEVAGLCQEGGPQKCLQGLSMIRYLLDISDQIPALINLWSVQNAYLDALKARWNRVNANERGGSDEELKSFLALGERLYFDLEAIQKFIEKGLT